MGLGRTATKETCLKIPTQLEPVKSYGPMLPSFSYKGLNVAKVLLQNAVVTKIRGISEQIKSFIILKLKA